MKTKKSRAVLDTPEESLLLTIIIFSAMLLLINQFARTIKQFSGTEKSRNLDQIENVWLVESPNFEGLAEVLSVNDDDTVNVRSDYTGAIHIVNKSDLVESL